MNAQEQMIQKWVKCAKTRVKLGHKPLSEAVFSDLGDLELRDKWVLDNSQQCLRRERCWWSQENRMERFREFYSCYRALFAENVHMCGVCMFAHAKGIVPSLELAAKIKNQLSLCSGHTKRALQHVQALAQQIAVLLAHVLTQIDKL
jgi:hypothetical protein